MRQTIFLFGMIFFTVSAVAQSKLEFKLDQARVFLAKRELDEALIVLHSLEKQLPNNANISFYLGATYTELNKPEESIKHLIKAARNVDEDYVSTSYGEESPIHVFYYLTLAMTETDQCANAHEAYDLFRRYKEKIEPYYLEEARKYTEKCPTDESEKGQLAEMIWKGEQPIVKAGIEKLPIELVGEIAVDSIALLQRGMLVQKLEYTTKTPLYGVQLASHSRPAPIGSYSNIKNVDVFIGTNGEIRYVVGHFTYRSQAERLLEKILKKGYKDAFVVNVNDERKYSNELISYNNVNLKAGIKGKVEYYIQLAAISKEISEGQLEMYFDIEGISEIKYEEKTILAIGAFKTYKESEIKQLEMKEKGYKDAYIVAFNKGKKIDLTMAKKYTD